MAWCPIAAEHILHVFHCMLLQASEHDSPELVMHEAPVERTKAGNIVKDVSPEIVIISLANDQPLSIERQLGAAIQRRTGKLLEHHSHFPLQKDGGPRLGYVLDVHMQFPTAAGKAIAQGFKVYAAFNPLNGILEYDVFVVIRK